MLPETIQALNEIDKNFYKTTVPYLNHASNYFWEGWINVLNSLDKLQSVELNVLDIGSGDGRFLEFLLTNGQKIQNYTGIDNSSTLLEIAKSRAKRLNFLNATWLQQDFIENKLKLESKFNFITLFGILHHLPTTGIRVQILKQAKEMLQKNGLLIFTTFQYLDIPRLKRQIVDSKTEIGLQIFKNLGLNPNELQNGDNILEWTKILTTKETIKAYRYSHYFTQNEVENLCKEAGLEILETWEDDGVEGPTNKYFLVK